jgi:hypothetical protein
MTDIIEYEIDSDEYEDDGLAGVELSTFDIENVTDIATVDIGIGNSRKINFQNFIARHKVERMQERLRLRKLLEDY